MELKRNRKGHIIYQYRGQIARGIGNSYVCREGYSATIKDGGILYPWLTRAECRRDAERAGSKAVFKKWEPDFPAR